MSTHPLHDANDDDIRAALTAIFATPGPDHVPADMADPEIQPLRLERGQNAVNTSDEGDHEQMLSDLGMHFPAALACQEAQSNGVAGIARFRVERQPQAGGAAWRAPARWRMRADSAGTTSSQSSASRSSAAGDRVSTIMTRWTAVRSRRPPPIASRRSASG